MEKPYQSGVYSRWLQEDTLREKYPRLFNLETKKEITVAEWIAIAKRRGEMEGTSRLAAEFNTLREEVMKISLNDKKDKAVCKTAPENTFTVSWYRKTMAQLTEGKSTNWSKWIPRRHNIFMWRFRRRRLPTRDNLTKMGINIINPLCHLCGHSTETVDHLFFKCFMASKLWESFYHWWNLNSFDVDSLDTLEDWWDNSSFKVRQKKCIYVSMVAVYQELWDARNAWIFKDEKPNMENSIRKYKDNTFFWISSRSTKLVCNRVGWHIAPSFIFM